MELRVTVGKVKLKMRLEYDINLNMLNKELKLGVPFNKGNLARLYVTVFRAIILILRRSILKVVWKT